MKSNVMSVKEWRAASNKKADALTSKARVQAQEEGEFSDYEVLGRSAPRTDKETDFQRATADLLALYPDVNAHAFHVANESRRSGRGGDIERMMLKTQGVKSGVADWIILKPSGNYHGAAIELKVKGGKVSAAQDIFLKQQASAGYYVAVCYSLEAFEGVIKKLYR